MVPGIIFQVSNLCNPSATTCDLLHYAGAGPGSGVNTGELAVTCAGSGGQTFSRPVSSILIERQERKQASKKQSGDGNILCEEFVEGLYDVDWSLLGSIGVFNAQNNISD